MERAQVVYITGAGRGIGRATAHYFAKKGYKVLIGSRSKEELAETQSHFPEQIHTCILDVGQGKSVNNFFAFGEKQVGPLNVLINSAAIAQSKIFVDETEETLANLLNINVLGTLLCSKAAFQIMMKNGGGIVLNISSLAGLQYIKKFEGFTAYTTSKAALIGFTESLATEGLSHGIRVNTLAPGAVETKMLRDVAPFLKTQTLPEDVAEILYGLTNPELKRITGAIIPLYSNLNL